MGLLSDVTPDQWMAMSLLGSAGMQGNWGQGVSLASQYLAGAKEREQRGLLAGLQLENLRGEMADRQAARDWRNSLPTPEFMAGQQALSAGGGPTLQNAANIPAVSPASSLLYSGFKAGAIPVDAFLKSLSPPKRVNEVNPGDFTPESLAKFNATGNYGDLVRLDKLHFADTGGSTQGLNPFTGQPVGPATAKTGNPFTDLLLASGTGSMVPNKPLIDARSQIAKAGASNVSVNTGQKGLDNELKIRGDFRSEPVYKAFGEVQSAHQQITAALKQASPAGDMAGATKIMKILDPGSVVRESELGMAMAATGLMDRLNNYASMVINGTKLTPQQRTDFQNLADTLYAESAKQYNSKRGEYSGFATDYGLNAERILGPEAQSAKHAQQPTVYPQLPPASQFTGKTAVNPATGQRMRSDGKQWVEVQ